MHIIRVWDLPTRLFHWALACCVVGLLITGNVGGNWMNWHLRLGYAVLTLLLFRLVWGLIGGHWSRFSSFLYTPSTALNYLKGQARPEHTTGHNPLGALSVFALLAVLLAQVGSGLISDDEIAFFGPLVAFVSGETVSQATRYHKSIGKFIVLGLVLLHIAAILFHKLVKKEILVLPMVLGDKAVSTPMPGSRDTGFTRCIALAVFSLCAAAVYVLVWLGETGSF
ncbi:cytochrome b/b6 domain-containing protein [Hydrogenophaga sp.]|uniref:cytochrome b/b6 domain-containing protein n=1 Tax=Hydrogenophaga sp. TaxID=1904254 RepID=UPI003F6B9631